MYAYEEVKNTGLIPWWIQFFSFMSLICVINHYTLKPATEEHSETASYMMTFISLMLRVVLQTHF